MCCFLQELVDQDDLLDESDKVKPDPSTLRGMSSTSRGCGVFSRNNYYDALDGTFEFLV